MNKERLEQIFLGNNTILEQLAIEQQINNNNNNPNNAPAQEVNFNDIPSEIRSIYNELREKVFKAILQNYHLQYKKEVTKRISSVAKAIKQRKMTFKRKDVQREIVGMTTVIDNENYCKNREVVKSKYYYDQIKALYSIFDKEIDKPVKKTIIENMELQKIKKDNNLLLTNLNNMPQPEGMQVVN